MNLALPVRFQRDVLSPVKAAIDEPRDVLKIKRSHVTLASKFFKKHPALHVGLNDFGASKRLSEQWGADAVPVLLGVSVFSVLLDYCLPEALDCVE